MSATVLVDPNGVEYVSDSAVEVNNLLNKGYTRKPSKSATPQAPSVAAAPKSDK